MTRRARTAWIAPAVAAALLVASPPARAEIQQLEAAGAVPVGKGKRATRDTRDAAVREALREAVVRVAREQLIDAAVEEEVDDATLAKALGEQVLPYTTRYRIVEDRGERKAMFGDANGATEYVVVVEVSVDTDRVEERLVAVGLLVRGGDHGRTSRIRIEIRGLLHYPGFAAMRDLIAKQTDGAVVHPVEFTRGRAVVELELGGAAGAIDPAALARRLERAGPPTLSIERVSVGERSIVLAAVFTPQPAASGSDEGGPAARR